MPWGTTYTMQTMHCHNAECGLSSRKVYKNGKPLDKVCSFCGHENLWEVSLEAYNKMHAYLEGESDEI